jgi:serine/threonine protein kinase
MHHICIVHSVDNFDGQPVIVMELIEGETLEAKLAHGPLVPEKALSIAIQMADALAEAHRKGIVHRDLKPANVMLTKSGVKVLDFGIAKAADDDTLTKHWLPGTPAYMAPEQREGRKCDARADIYSFGLVLQEMATGKRFVAGQPATLDGLSSSLVNLIRGCLEADPADRWQSAADLHKQAVDLHKASGVRHGRSWGKKAAVKTGGRSATRLACMAGNNGCSVTGCARFPGGFTPAPKHAQ